MYIQQVLIAHIRRNFSEYKLLVVGAVAAAIVGAVASIVYDSVGPAPWNTHMQDQQQITATTSDK